jgi:prevent-host-death family protein
MHEFGAFEAKNKFGHLLDLVEQGEEVTITRHGKEVARLVPARHLVNRDEARAALQRIRARAEQRDGCATLPSKRLAYPRPRGAEQARSFRLARRKAHRDEGRP